MGTWANEDWCQGTVNYNVTDTPGGAIEATTGKICLNYPGFVLLYDEAEEKVIAIPIHRVIEATQGRKI